MSTLEKHRQAAQLTDVMLQKRMDAARLANQLGELRERYVILLADIAIGEAGEGELSELQLRMGQMELELRDSQLCAEELSRRVSVLTGAEVQRMFHPVW